MTSGGPAAQGGAPRATTEQQRSRARVVWPRRGDPAAAMGRATCGPARRGARPTCVPSALARPAAGRGGLRPASDADVAGAGALVVDVKLELHRHAPLHHDVRGAIDPSEVHRFVVVDGLAPLPCRLLL